MTDGYEDVRFKCAFSSKGLRYNLISTVVITILLIAAVGYVCFILKSSWVFISSLLLLLILLWISMNYINALTKDSYLEITSDGLLKCFYKGRAPVSYLIKEIATIEEASLEQAIKRYATFSVVLNTRGWELYPSEGVLISFNRSWYKSVFPVYFAPEDIKGFITVLRQRTGCDQDS